MGVVVSAVASGLVQNVKADLIKEKEEKEVKDADRKQQDRIVESPGRIQTPGYPSIILQQETTPTPTTTTTLPPTLPPPIIITPVTADVLEPSDDQVREEVEEVEGVTCQSPSFLDNILSSLRMSSQSVEEPNHEPEPEPEPEPESEFFPVERLPVVSLLPTLTEEISISLAQSQSSKAGWFRRNYTSIDTVQKIYGTHPRYGQRRRCQTRLGLSRPRR